MLYCLRISWYKSLNKHNCFKLAIHVFFLFAKSDKVNIWKRIKQHEMLIIFINPTIMSFTAINFYKKLNLS